MTIKRESNFFTYLPKNEPPVVRHGFTTYPVEHPDHYHTSTVDVPIEGAPKEILMAVKAVEKWLGKEGPKVTKRLQKEAANREKAHAAQKAEIEKRTAAAEERAAVRAKAATKGKIQRAG